MFDIPDPSLPKSEHNRCLNQAVPIFLKGEEAVWVQDSGRRGVPKPQPSRVSGKVCTTLGKEPWAHSLDTSRAADGHWLRACDARVSSSSRSSAVKSSCGPNGSSGSRAAATGKPRARLLGGCPVLGSGPELGVGGPLRLLLPGAAVPAMPAAGKRLKGSSAAWLPQSRRTGQTPARRRSPQALGPRPRVHGPISCQLAGAEQ